MSAQKAFQTATATAEQSHGGAHIPDGLLQRRGLMTVKELAAELRFTITAPGDPEDACRAWLRRHRIVGLTRGRLILVDPADVRRALRKVA